MGVGFRISSGSGTLHENRDMGCHVCDACDATRRVNSSDASRLKLHHIDHAGIMITIGKVGIIQSLLNQMILASIGASSGLSIDFDSDSRMPIPMSKL